MLPSKREVLMRSVTWVALICALLATPARDSAGDDETPSKRLVALEAEARRLLAEVEALRARLPRDENSVRAEISAEYESMVGEPIPEAVLAQATSAVLQSVRRLVKQAVARAVDEGRKSPLTNTLVGPLVILQVRSGAGGGNPSRVDMVGGLSGYVDERSRREIPWSPVVGINEDSRAFALGGSIPRGKAFVITRATWRGVAAGDSNGHGEFVVRVGRRTLASARDDKAVREGSWEGRIVIRAGEESQVQCEVANSSHVEARLEGELVDAATAGTSKD